MVVCDLSYEGRDGNMGSVLHHWDNVDTVRKMGADYLCVDSTLTNTLSHCKISNYTTY